MVERKNPPFGALACHGLNEVVP